MLTRLWIRLDKYLKGKPDKWITTALLITITIAAFIAVAGPRPLKAAVLLYFWFP